MLRKDDHHMEIDSRPSDGIALAVRVHAGIWVEDSVMERAGILPERDVREEPAPSTNAESNPSATLNEKRLDVFKDFIDQLDSSDSPDSDSTP
jgi:bifunctional DNase/RNase